MFETAEVGNAVEKSTYKREEAKLRQTLLEAQKALAGSKLAVVVLVGGVEGAGKTHMVNQMLEWLDARGIETHAMGAPSDEERERPPMWRFWRLLPPAGRMGIFLGSWYTEPIVGRAMGTLSGGAFDQAMDRIVDFEEMLDHENVLVVKVWLHLKKELVKKRFEKLEADPLTAWRITKQDWSFFRRYDRFRAVSERALRRTGTGAAPWHIVEATDWRYRNLTVGRLLQDTIAERLDRMAKAPKPERAPDHPKPPKVSVLTNLDLTRTLSESKYEKALEKLQGDLNRLSRRLYEKRKSLTVVFEGPDAAGKGGAIRRLMQGTDVRDTRVISIAAPTEEERSHPYLWRFWRHLPRLGKVTIYDRSWYGRVLVERVEGFCPKEDWQRAFGEINAFEEQLTDFGIVLVKFWLAITPQEQLRRFKDREVTPYKQYKITEEDWRNRAKWDAYEAAAVDMFERTSGANAPWVQVEAVDKNYARVKVLETVVKRLKRTLD